MRGGSSAQPTAMCEGDDSSALILVSVVVSAGRYPHTRRRRHRLTGQRVPRRFPRVKPGELERNLSRLAEAARTARERLATMAQELAELRLEMERLSLPAEAPRTEPSSETGAATPMEGHGGSRRDRVDSPVRIDADRTGREVGSE